jgi:hypothetical protein
MENDNNYIEIEFSEVILDEDLYLYYSFGGTRDEADDFEKGNSIIYFRGNYTWRAEIIKKVENGYIVKDY